MNIQNKVFVFALDKKFKKMEKPLHKVVFNLLKEFSKLRGVAIELYLVGNKFMAKNVLAFSAPKKFPRPDLRGKKWLGEIYLNPKYIERHASRVKRQELIYMLIHGFLHLLGYDHKKESDRIKMEKKEQHLLAQ